MLVKVKDLFSFLIRCRDENILGINEIIIPCKSSVNKSEKSFYKVMDGLNETSVDGFRTADPTKILFYLNREVIYPAEFQNKKRVLIGVKSCDLNALKILDNALMSKDFTDPSYKHWRDNTFVISSDCTSISDTCHCNLVGSKPFADDGYDINLSKFGDSFVVISGSQKGDDLITVIREVVDTEQVAEEVRERVKMNRNNILSLLGKQNMKFKQNINELALRDCDSELWLSASKQCVGCGACTNICPTCYCLILNDETKSEQFIKVRSTDSCQYNGYARVAGGGTPRSKVDQRFRNRYLCKFDYMNSNFNEIGCTGCGRCIDACPANIDLREVVYSMLREPVSKSERT